MMRVLVRLRKVSFCRKHAATPSAATTLPEASADGYEVASLTRCEAAVPVSFSTSRTRLGKYLATIQWLRRVVRDEARPGVLRVPGCSVTARDRLLVELGICLNPRLQVQGPCMLRKHVAKETRPGRQASQAHWRKVLCCTLVTSIPELP